MGLSDLKATARPAAGKGGLQHARCRRGAEPLHASSWVACRRRVQPDEAHDVHHALDFRAVGKDHPALALDVVGRESS